MKSEINHERYMLQALTRLGLPEGERPDVWVLGAEITNQGEKVQFQAWTCESLLYAIREMAMGDRCNWRVVVRCFGQAKQYLGRTGGFPISCYVNDALSYVQSELERRVSDVHAA